MNLKTKVKVGNISNLSDARYCAGMGVDWLGFSALTSPQEIKTLMSWVVGPQFIIETNGALSDELQAAFPDVVQALTVAGLKEINTTQKCVVTLHAANFAECLTSLQNKKDQIEFLQLTLSGNEVADMKHIEAAGNAGFTVYVQPAGFGEAEIEKLISLPITGIALLGSTEEATGLQDYDHLSPALEFLTAD